MCFDTICLYFVVHGQPFFLTITDMQSTWCCYTDLSKFHIFCDFPLSLFQRLSTENLKLKDAKQSPTKGKDGKCESQPRYIPSITGFMNSIMSQDDERILFSLSSEISFKSSRIHMLRESCHSCHKKDAVYTVHFYCRTEERKT